MFKKGDIVVRIKDHSTIKDGRPQRYSGYIYKCIKQCERAWYKTADDCRGSLHHRSCRKATDNEIKWFEAGITNINQIPEVGGTFGAEKIESIHYILEYPIKTNGGTYSLKYWFNHYFKSYKPPVKSQHVGNKVPIDTPFEIGDLKNCKIGNLTPEDHKIIQPFLFSLGYNWQSGAHLTKTDQPYLCTTGNNYIFKKSNVTDFSRLQRTLIKKELILNYIKQLNTNKNEVHRQNQEITRRTINGSSRILSGRQQGSTGSRPKGNVTSVKGRKTYFRRSEICGSVRLW